MIELRQLIVVTGTVHVEGGETNTVLSRDDKGRSASEIVLNRKVSPDRRAANVITTDYMRKLRKLALLRTPFGALITPEQLPELKAIVAAVGRKISEYNAVPNRRCHLSNCVLWERLAGNRLSAVAGWVSARAAAGDGQVKAALPNLSTQAA